MEKGQKGGRKRESESSGIKEVMCTERKLSTETRMQRCTNKPV